jgi:hypothetical protein
MRRLGEEALRLTEQRLELLHDPGTPAETVATLIMEAYPGQPVRPGLAQLLLESGRSVADLTDIAEALGGADPKGSLTALTFGAHAAHLAGDHRLARSHVDRAFALAHEPEVRMRLAANLRGLDRLADAIELLNSLVTDRAYGALGAVVHGDALQAAQARVTAEIGPQGACSCGSGRAWSDCCRLRELRAVDRFLDRSGLDALDRAVEEYLPGTPYERPVKEHVADWLNTADARLWEPPERDSLERLAMEHAWVVAARAGVDGGLPDVTDDIPDDVRDDHDNVLTMLAADPATSPDIAARAEAWRDHARYGLWQVVDPVPAPGLWCTDVCTGHELYVAFPPEQVDRLPRWGVLLGAIVPVDGAWRPTSALIRLSPTEADALFETIRAAVEVVVGDIAGRPNRRAADRLRLSPPFGFAEPRNVYADEEEPALPEVAVLVGRVVGSVLPRLLAELLVWRRATQFRAGTLGHPVGGREKQWLDEPVSALGGRTPRQAARSADRARLEGLIRQLEYDSDGPTDADEPAPDTEWLRDQLDLLPQPW